MVPALLLLVQSALAASPAAPAALPSEKQLRADARAWVEALCAERKDKCEPARGALAGYESLLPQTAACEAGPCAAPQIASLTRFLSKFNETVAALPAPKGQSVNALLRLGALGGVRLAAAAAAVKDDFAALSMASDEATAAATVEQLCLEAPGPACENARQVVALAKAEGTDAEACGKTPCPFERLDELALASHANMLRSLGSLPGVKTSTLPLFVAADKPLKEATLLLARFVDEATGRLRGGADAYETRVAAAEKDSGADARALPGEAQTLMVSYQEASYAADRLEELLAYDKTAGAKRDAVNAQVHRLGTLRARAFAAVTARGLAPMNATDALAVVGGVPGAGGAAQPAKLKPGVALTTSKPTLLDERTLPPPSGSGPAAPPIISGAPVLTLPFRAFSKDPLVSADAKRRLGLTRTVGAPGTYAKYVYGQAGDNTCAVASQVSALRAMGLLGTKEKPEEQERQSAALLASKGYFRNGTTKEYSGELMISKGVLVEKHVDAKWNELEAAIRRGSLIQAGVDATPLWNMPGSKPRPHSILVTGGEIDKRTHQLLGAYINDTGDDPPKGGRFVPLALLKRAWGGDFVEVVR